MTSSATAYKASLIGAAQQFELTEQGLSWRFAGRSGVWPYADIARSGFVPAGVDAGQAFSGRYQPPRRPNPERHLGLVADGDPDGAAERSLSRLHRRSACAARHQRQHGAADRWPRPLHLWRSARRDRVPRRGDGRPAAARARPSPNGRRRCSWSASPRCSPGMSAASSLATSRAATRSRMSRSRCCRDHVASYEVIECDHVAPARHARMSRRPENNDAGSCAMQAG